MPYSRRIPFVGSGALTYAQTVLADSPGGYWKLDETSGDSLADQSGHGLTLTRMTTAGTGPVVNQSPLISTGKSVLFTPSSAEGYLKVATSSYLDLADTFTLELWLTLGASGSAVRLLQKGVNTYDLSINASSNVELSKYGATLMCTSTSGISVGPTYHLVATKSGATIKLYINAVDATGAVTNATCSDSVLDFEIGRYGSGIQYYDGKIDEVAVYPTALSQARVQAHYDARTL